MLPLLSGDIFFRLLLELLSASFGAEIVRSSLVDRPRRSFADVDADTPQVAVMEADGIFRNRAGMDSLHRGTPSSEN
jgi:hypothetical protein